MQAEGEWGGEEKEVGEGKERTHVSDLAHYRGCNGPTGPYCVLWRRTLDTAHMTITSSTTGNFPLHLGTFTRDFSCPRIYSELMTFVDFGVNQHPLGLCVLLPTPEEVAEFYVPPFSM